MRLFRRRTLPLITLALALPLRASTPEDQAVLAPIHAMLDAMARHDATALQLPLLPGGSLTLMRDGKPTQMTFSAFAERINNAGTRKIEERIHDPVIHIDRDLAVVWAPFDFLADGKVDHCGTDLFSLIRQNGVWLIVSIADTGRNDCPAR